MHRRTKALVAAAALVLAVTVGTGIAVAVGGGDDGEAPITGVALERASGAALEHTGGGRVTDSEVGDEDSYYEVEVTLDDGRQIDVQLDEDFSVVDSVGDDDSTEDTD